MESAVSPHCIGTCCRSIVDRTSLELLILNQLQVEAFTADAGLDIFHHIGLSGETLMEIISKIYLGETGVPQAPKTVDQIWDTNVRLRAFQKEYMDYWNSTSMMTSSGKPVVAVLSPVSAVAAYRFDKTNPCGMSLCCCFPNDILPG